MELRDRVIIVTGAGRGIGAALCRRFSAESPAAVIVSDVDRTAAEAVAEEIGGISAVCDVSDREDVQKLTAFALEQFGRVDVFCSNAGITVKGDVETSPEDWQTMWDVNVMSRVHAAAAVLPAMLRQGEGYLLHVASAAGLLTEIGSASYSVTKHADVALAEWLAVRHGRDGIRVSCVCPLGVATGMLDEDDPIHRYLHLHVVTPEDVAECVAAGIRAEEFLILPQPQVQEFRALKTEDHDRWIRGMQRLRQKLTTFGMKRVRNPDAA